MLITDIKPGENLTPHLKGSEVLSACAWDKPDSDIDERLFQIFEIVRRYAGNTPIKFHSGFRNFIPPGGSKNSAHLRGKAMDLHISKAQMNLIKSRGVEFLTELFFSHDLKGIAVYSWGLHIDIDDTLSADTEWMLDQTNEGKGTFFGRLRHWNTPLWLKKNPFQEGPSKKLSDADVAKIDKVGHEDEVLREQIKKGLPFFVLGLTATLFYIFKTYRK